jgi:predicted ATP-dependent serine protease
MVDAELYFEGESGTAFRMLRAEEPIRRGE